MFSNHKQKTKNYSKRSQVGSSWKRKSNKKTPSAYRDSKIEEKVKKAQTTSLSTKDLLTILSRHSAFIGVYGSDQLGFLKIVNYPCFFIANTMPSYTVGSHWIAVRLSQYEIEIFDSLGYTKENWIEYSSELLNFFMNYSYTHRFIVCPTLQSAFSTTCGLFSIFFIIFRVKYSFRKLVSRFGLDLDLNNRKLCRMLVRNTL